MLVNENNFDRTNWDRWVDLLATTDAPQCQEKLGTVSVQKGQEVKAFCCLGLGSFNAGIDLVRSDEDPHSEDCPDDCADHPDVGEPIASLYFGEAAKRGDGSELAPREFIEWLGLDVEDDVTGFDVVFDIPEELMTQKPEHAGTSLRLSATAAGLNDAGFTFAQIADVARYFGPLGVDY